MTCMTGRYFALTEPNFDYGLFETSRWKKPFSRERRVTIGQTAFFAAAALGVLLDPLSEAFPSISLGFLLLLVVLILVSVAVLFEHGVFLAVTNQDIPPKKKFLGGFFAGFLVVLALFMTLSLTWFFETELVGNPLVWALGLYVLAGFLRYHLKFWNHKDD